MCNNYVVFKLYYIFMLHSVYVIRVRCRQRNMGKGCYWQYEMLWEKEQKAIISGTQNSPEVLLKVCSIPMYRQSHVCSGSASCKGLRAWPELQNSSMPIKLSPLKHAQVGIVLSNRYRSGKEVCYIFECCLSVVASVVCLFMFTVLML